MLESRKRRRGMKRTDRFDISCVYEIIIVHGGFLDDVDDPLSAIRLCCYCYFLWRVSWTGLFVNLRNVLVTILMILFNRRFCELK